MNIKPVKTERDYQLALKEIEKIFDAKPNSAESDRLEVLAILVQAYEEEHYPIDAADNTVNKIPNYSFQIRRLQSKEGNGFLIEYPDLPGCMSDGGTIEDTIKNGSDAVACWIAAAKESGRVIPKPKEPS